MRNSSLRIVSVVLAFAAVRPALAAPPTRDQAAEALRKAVGFFQKDVSIEGGYLWRYSADLSKREGENKATATAAWVQPPGTPSVGDALLDAWRLTGDPQLLDAARQTAHALVLGQLRSGGWDYRIEYAPADRKRHAYRVEPEGPKQRNVTTLDDDTTQSAIRFLMHIDQALEFKEAKIHEAARFALDSLLKAQYPNGAWPQRFDAFPDPAKFPVKPAGYPDAWSREWPNKQYTGYYTFNDNALADVIDVMFEAARVYRDDRYFQAARKAGDFIILAQMPEPQPAWAQQYDADMHPAWARKFEPPSVTGGESHGAMQILMRIYRETGDAKYLEPIPRALAYLRKSQLPDGRMARFYELKTNRPLFFTKKYELTYDSSDMPTHYGFITSNRLDSIQKQYDRVKATDPKKLNPPARRDAPKLSPALESQAADAIAALDKRGAWVEKGRMRNFGDDDDTKEVITTSTFIKNIETLARYLAATKN
jgi:PelA/Pel-15E family pectate lyase